jgi:hypothetical protein
MNFYFFNILNYEYLLTYLLTYSLITGCGILFEKLIVTQTIKKYPALFMEHEGSSPCPPLGPILSQLNPVRPIDP